MTTATVSSPLALFTVMNQYEPLGNIMFWDEHDVHLWLTGLGLPQYEMQIREHHITGDILVQLNAESLKEIGIATVGQRLLILKAVYQVKLAQGVEIEPGHYIPPSELGPPHGHSGQVERDVTQTLRATASEDRCPWSEGHGDGDVGKSVNPSPNAGITSVSQPTSSSDTRARTALLHGASVEQPDHRETIFPGIHTGALNSDKKGKAHADDPVWKVLPVALKKHNITEHWQNYVMFICYGQTELRLAYDDKPRRIFKKFQEENKNPVFVLKHISDIHGENGDHENGTFCSSSRSTFPGITYAVAIHPYKTGKGAPFNVVPGDAFIVISRDQVRWIVQCDLSGTGIVNSTMEQVRIPPGCLLETDVPIAFASAAAFAARASLECSSTRSLPASNSPILPRNIISTGFPSLALMSYRKSNEDGLDLSCGDLVHVYKRYKHLSYLVKENGDRGWVPTWLVSKNTRAGKSSTSTPPPLS